MKKLLLFDKHSEMGGEIKAALSECFYVQACEIKPGLAGGMMKVISPELVIISLAGVQPQDREMFDVLSVEYKGIPVITVGTEEEKNPFSRFYEGEQFKHLPGPVEKKAVLEAVCDRLGLEITADGDKYTVTEAVNKSKILVVDDDPVTLRGVRELIKEEYDVSVAISGMDAMKAIEKKKPDLILLDYEMPGCNGKQTLEMIRANHEYKYIPVIFLTGLGDKAHIADVMKLRPQGYIIKPATKSKLVDAFDKKNWLFWG